MFGMSWLQVEYVAPDILCVETFSICDYIKQ